MNVSTADALAAADPRRSAWVSANAGAGKTFTLANRVTRLLLDGAAPGKILCLTYTKAAAAEMQGRLFDQLGRWAMLDDNKLAQSIADIGAEVRGAEGLREARRLFAKALETPGGLKIQTIHSFCQYLLARFPLEAGVPPSFRVLDEATARELMSEARTRVLERASSGHRKLDDAIALLATNIDEGRLQQILDSTLAGDRRKFERFLDTLPDGDDAMSTAIYRAHGADPDEREDDIAARFCAEMKNEDANLRGIADWLASGTKTDKVIADALLKAVASGAFDDFRQVFYTKTENTPRRSLATKGRIKDDPGLHLVLEQVAQRFAAAEQRWRGAHAAALTDAALTLAQAAYIEYSTAKRARGVLDYDDLILESLRLLEQREAAAWVLYKLDGGLDHILIDEGQDTSPEQWRIVRRLAEEFFAGKDARDETAPPRTLFVVGDEKQSIFSFQGAEPALFAINRDHFAERAGVAENGFVSAQLSISRRSAPEILSFVDTVFAAPTTREGVSSSDEPIAHKAWRDEAKGRVEFWSTIKPLDSAKIDPWQRPIDIEPESSPVVRLAEQIATRIHAWTNGRTRLPGHDRPIRPGDIMVLMPRREPFATEFIRQLKQRGVPVAGADRIRLGEQIAVMDLIALGNFALLPEDDLNLAALLRSPLLGLSEDELFALAASRTGTLWRALGERSRDSAAFAFADSFLRDCLARADFAPPYEFYAQALVAHGMRQRLLARLGAEANDAIDEFLSLALAYESLNTPSLQGFLHWIARGDAEIKRDMERGRDEVRVMTVHGAKGLEADIVILPDTTAVPQGSGKHGALLYTEDGVLFPLPDTLAPENVLTAKGKADAATLAEHRRLLYVALTRARDRLHICGFESKRGVKQGSWYDLMQGAATSLGVPVTHGDATAQVIGVADTEPAEEIERVAERVVLPAWATQPAPPEQERPRLIRPSDAAGIEEPTGHSPGGDASRFERGLLVHTLLAKLPELKPESRRDAAHRFLARKGLTSDAASALVDETMAVIEDPAFAAAFSPTARAEAAIVADLPELGADARVSGRIDRLAVNDNEILAIDFKTNRPPPKDLASVPRLYMSQMALYRAALAKVFPGKRIACALVWTDGPMLMPLPDADLEAEMGPIGARLDPRQGRS